MAGSFRSEARPERDREYWIDGERIHFEVDDQIVSLDVPEWEEIVAAYSSDGLNETKAQIAVRFDIPRPVLERMLRAAGIYKSSPPFSPERMEEAKSTEDIEDLVSASLELKTHRFQARLQRREIVALRKEVDALRARERDEKRVVSEVAEAVASVDLPRPPKKVVRVRAGSLAAKDMWACHAPVVDLHVGKFAWDEEDYGENYDTEIAAQRLYTHGLWIAQRISRIDGLCECYLTDLGDFIHALHSVTESGTPLHQDSRNKLVYRMAIAAKIEQIEAVRAAARKVVILGVPGNHAGFVDWAVLEALAMRYESTPDVEIRTTYRPQAHFLFGETLHVLDHGKGMSKLTAFKAQAQADLVARETAGEDYARAKSIYLYVGHLHELQVGSHGKHMQLIRLPSMAEADEYETSLRYAGLPVAHAYVLDEKGRISEEWRHYF